MAGRGGVGKSEIIKRLKVEFEKLGYIDFVNDGAEKSRVHCIALTHVAAGNIDGDTILHNLHRHPRSKRIVVIVDESSMVPLSQWAALANLKFVGNIVVVLGDMAGQFQPIEDQGREERLVNMDSSKFMHDLVNGLHVTLSKYRRGRTPATSTSLAASTRTTDGRLNGRWRGLGLRTRWREGASHRRRPSASATCTGWTPTRR